jgi:prophage tail gpP-like protein
MATDPNRLTLRINGVDFGGWKSQSVNTTIEAAASSFSLDVTESWPGQADPIRIYIGDECEVMIGGECVLTGYVEDVNPSHDGTSRTISISGHSWTVDLTECSCISDTGPLQFKAGQTIKQIAEALCAPYSVSVVCNLTDIKTLPRFVPEVGETVFAAIERLAREEGILVTDDEYGRLVLTRIADAEQGDDLICPGNILRASGKYSGRDRFTEYRVKGQRAGDDQNFGTASTSGAVIEDDDLPRRRVLVIKAERQSDAAACQRRATSEATIRAGRSVNVSVTVAGWRDSKGALYQKNVIHYVRDPQIYCDGYLLAVGVEFTADESGGLISVITLAPPGAYETEPPKVRAASRRGRITKAASVFDRAKGDANFGADAEADE